MQEKDLVSIEYFEDPERFADLLNGYLFDGKPVVKPGNVRERNRVVTRTARVERRIENGYVIRDVVQDVGIGRTAFDVGNERRELGEEQAGYGKPWSGLGMQVTIVALEEQAKVHYAMPVRVMNSDATTYHRQWRKKRKSHWKKKDLRGAEYLSGFSRTDKLIPALTIVVYFGTKPWDGPRNLKDMLDLSGVPEPLASKIADYPMELLEVRDYQNTEKFHTDVRQVFEFLQRAPDKEKLAEYVEENKQVFSELEEDAYDMISCMSKSGELKVIKKKCQKEKGGKVDMCQAITEMIEDGRREGMIEGELMFARLTKILLKDGKVEILSQAADDEKYRRKLYRKYDIK